MPMRRLICGFAACAVLSASLAAQEWPQFRGRMAGVAVDHPDLPETWSTTENVRWVVDIPGVGWSSPVVWGDHVFVTSACGAEVEDAAEAYLAVRGRQQSMGDIARPSRRGCARIPEARPARGRQDLYSGDVRSRNERRSSWRTSWIAASSCAIWSTASGFVSRCRSPQFHRAY